jgi:serine/threonine protein kinase
MGKLRPYIKNGPYIIMEDTDVFKSYGLCNLKLTRPLTNLKKIKIKTNLKDRPEFFNKPPIIDLYYNGKKMKKTKILGEGSTGIVYLFEYSDNRVAIKIPDSETYVDYEVDIIDDYLKNICEDNIIPLKIIDDQVGNSFVVMQEANGDLSDIKMDERLIFKIIFRVAEMLICFLERDIIYFDLKLENILYKCQGNNINIYLADIGAFTIKGDLIQGGTFVPPEALDKKYYKANKNIVTYSFGCFIAQLYGYDYLGYKNERLTTKENITEYYYPKFIEKVKSDNRVPNSIKALIISFTEIDPKKRKQYDIDNVFDLINVGNQK